MDKAITQKYTQETLAEATKEEKFTLLSIQSHQCSTIQETFLHWKAKLTLTKSNLSWSRT